jgi:N-acetylmuramic acid 6-phosphate etherase
MRFRIGLDGLEHRPPRAGDGVTAVAAARDLPLLEEDGVFAGRLDVARSAGARAAVIVVGRGTSLERLTAAGAARASEGLTLGLPVGGTPFLLDPLTRIGAKMLLNALSTCTMVRLGRVLGNRMICLVPSNLKLVDRSTRYVRDLAGVSYEEACRALFDVIDYVEPRRRAGKAYPAPVGVATMRLRHGLSLPEAEARLGQELA